MRTIAILNFKGGVGKTLSTATLAYLGAQKGKRLLLIDADSQGNLSMSFGMQAEDGMDTLELLEHGAGFYPEFVTPTSIPGIDIIPSDIRLLKADVAMARNGTKDTQNAIMGLREAIEFDEAAEPGSAYDTIMIDCPPALSASCVAALAAADDVIIPIRPDYYSTAGMVNLTIQVQNMRDINPRLRVLGVLVTQYTNTREELDAVQSLRSGLLPVFQTVIRYSKRVPASTFSPDPLPVFSPGCAASVDYRKLADEIWGGVEHGEK